MSVKSTTRDGERISDDDAIRVRDRADGWEAAWSGMQLRLHEAARERLERDPGFRGKGGSDDALAVADELVFLEYASRAREGKLLRPWDPSGGSVESYLIGGRVFLKQANAIYKAMRGEETEIAGIAVQHPDQNPEDRQQWDIPGDPGASGGVADVRETGEGADEPRANLKRPPVKLHRLSGIGRKQKFVFVAQLWETIAGQDAPNDWSAEAHAGFRREALEAERPGDTGALEREISSVVRDAILALRQRLDEVEDDPKWRSVREGTMRVKVAEPEPAAADASDPEFAGRAEEHMKIMHAQRYRSETAKRRSELDDRKAYIHLLLWLHPLAADAIVTLTRCTPANANQKNKRYREKWPSMLPMDGVGECAVAMFKGGKP